METTRKDNPVYFLRHNLYIPKDEPRTIRLLEQIWRDQYAVIDYEGHEGAAAYNPELYKQPHEKHTVARFRRLLEQGGVVAVACRKIRKNELMLGTVIPVDALETKTFEVGETYPYKAAKLSNVKIVSISEYPVLFSKIPRQA